MLIFGILDSEPCRKIYLKGIIKFIVIVIVIIIIPVFFVCFEFRGK